jgi:acetyl-CoA synthetase
MGMIPELAIAVLACARIGAIHSVIFGGFSAQSIADRIQDAEASCVITCDGAFRGNKAIPLKSTIDDAMIGCPTVKRIIVCTHTRTPVSMIKGRDVWWEDEIKKVETQGNPFCEAEEMDAEDILYRQTQRSSAYLWRLHGVGQLHIRKCVSIPAGTNPFLHRRYRMDYRP